MHGRRDDGPHRFGAPLKAGTGGAAEKAEGIVESKCMEVSESPETQSWNQAFSLRARTRRVFERLFLKSIPCVARDILSRYHSGTVLWVPHRVVHTIRCFQLL